MAGKKKKLTFGVGTSLLVGSVASVSMATGCDFMVISNPAPVDENRWEENHVITNPWPNNEFDAGDTGLASDAETDTHRHEDVEIITNPWPWNNEPGPDAGDAGDIEAADGGDIDDVATDDAGDGDTDEADASDEDTSNEDTSDEDTEE